MSRKKIELPLNFQEIMGRINACKAQRCPERKTSNKKWAELVGVSESLVSQLHPKKEGKAGKEPSLEYIVAVAMATRESLDWFLFGKLYDTEILAVAEPQAAYCAEPKEVQVACHQLKEILLSDHSWIKPALLSNLAAFQHSVQEERNHKQQEEEIRQLKLELKLLREKQVAEQSTGTDEAASSSTGKPET